MTILEDVDLNFNLPIKYLDSKKIFEINEQMADDLELQTYKNTSLYKKILNPKTKIGDTIIPLWSKFYTDDVKYLNDTKTIFDFNIRPTSSLRNSSINHLTVLRRFFLGPN